MSILTDPANDIWYQVTLAMLERYRSPKLVAPAVLHLVGTEEAERMAHRCLSPLGKVAPLGLRGRNVTYEGSPLLKQLREQGLMS